MPKEEEQEVQQETGDSEVVEALKEIFESLDQLHKKVDELTAKDAEVHKMVE